MAETRTGLVQGCEAVDQDIVWAIATTDLAGLVAELEQALAVDRA